MAGVTPEEVEQLRQQLAAINLEKQILLSDKMLAEAKSTQERQRREAIEAVAERERQERLNLQVQLQLGEVQRRFMPIANPDEFYTQNGFLYLEASKDDFKRSIIGFGMTSEPIKRLAQYHSKATGAGKREFLKIWSVWNMPLLEAVIKEILSPWANPEEKEKPSHKKRSGLSKIEIFDIPFQSIVKIVDCVVSKFKDIVNSLREISKNIVIDACEPLPAFKPIKDIKAYIDNIKPLPPAVPAQLPPAVPAQLPPAVPAQLPPPAVPAQLPQFSPPINIVISLTGNENNISVNNTNAGTEDKLAKYITLYPPKIEQAASAYYEQVCKAIGNISRNKIRDELQKQHYIAYRNMKHKMWKKR